MSLAKKTLLLVTAITLALLLLPVNDPSAFAHADHRKQAKARFGPLRVETPQTSQTVSSPPAGRICTIQRAVEELATGPVWWNKYYLRLHWCFNGDDLGQFDVSMPEESRAFTHWEMVKNKIIVKTVKPHRAYVRVKATYKLCFAWLPVFCDYQTIWISASVSSWRWSDLMNSYYADFDSGGSG